MLPADHPFLTTDRLNVNTASAEELDRLHGVGPALAARIAEHRERNGPFRGPDDLARVPGIGADRARMLAQFLRWEVEVAAPETMEDEAKPDWSEATISIVSAIVLFAIFRPDDWLLRTLRHDPTRYQLSSMDVWKGGSIQLGITGWMSALLCFALAESFPALRARRGMARWLMGSLAAVILGVLSTGLVWVVDLTLFDAKGWGTLFEDPRLISGAAMGVALTLMVVPISLILRFPHMAARRWPHVLPGVAGFGAVALAVYMSLLGREYVTLQELVYLAVSGICGLFMGIGMLRGDSIGGVILNEVVARSRTRTQPSQLMAWLNWNLPDPEAQRALLVELQRAHPPSRWRTLGGALLIGASLWLFLEVAGAVIEYFVQNGLDRLFG